MANPGDNTGVQLNICWVTVRKVSDLCSTTTLSLAQGLIQSGHNLTLLNPDLSHVHENYSWTHHNLKQTHRKGFQASSVAKSAKDWFSVHHKPPIDLVLVDWQLANILVPFLQKKNYQMILMDRSPPADVSLLGKLQWRNWKMAWKYVMRGTVAKGCVVSKAHSDYIQQQFTIASDCIHILPAGVDSILFKSQRKPSIENEVRLVYHGRLDRHRGVLALPMLVQKLQNEGIKTELTLIGEGDVFETLKQISEMKSWLKVHPKMEQEGLAEILSMQHIGLLPMPESKVWSLASPLKRSEYLSAGLLVFGVKHNGHVLENTDSSWYHLVDEQDFHELGVKWIKSLNDSKFEKGSKIARVYATENCTWKESIDELNHAIQSLQKSS